jgi:hypothetical protein
MQGRRRGFYAYQRRQAHPVIAPVEGALLARVQAMAAETRERSGRRRMAQHLHKRPGVSWDGAQRAGACERRAGECDVPSPEGP